MVENELRLNKFLSTSGFCSRRAADALIEEGRVIVDGIAATMGMRVTPNSLVLVDGVVVEYREEHRIFAFNKPVGYISSLSDEQGEGIGRFIDDGIRLYPVGRLDKDSEGLMLLTNDGEFMNKVLNAANGHEKEYIVTVNKNIEDSFLTDMQKGVPIKNKATGKKIITAPCKTQKMDSKSFKIVLTQGLNRQIRRMCSAFGYNVVRLQRVRILNIELGELGPGELVELTGDRYRELMEIVK